MKTDVLLLVFVLLGVGCFSKPEDGKDGMSPAEDLRRAGDGSVVQPPADGAMGRTDGGISPCGAVNTPQNCGVCGNACPGVGLGNDDVSCTDPATKTCGMTCRGESYDVDKNPANGCEAQHSASIGHTETSAASLGSASCDDEASQNSFSGTILSDSRVHTNPALDGFQPTVGSAPDYWMVYATGGDLCENDYALFFSTSGGGTTACYRCTIQTDFMTDSITVSGSGSGSRSSGSGSYGSGSRIYFQIEKICSLPVQEDVHYTVSYHL